MLLNKYFAKKCIYGAMIFSLTTVATLKKNMKNNVDKVVEMMVITKRV